MSASPTVNPVAGQPTIRRKYTTPEDTLRHMALKIREAGRDPKQMPAFRQFAEAIISRKLPKSMQLSHERAAQIILDYIRENVRYRHDPPMVEFVQGPAITLCLPGAAACIPVGDCDDLIVAFGSLCMAYGIEVQVIAQDFGPDVDLHVCAAIKADNAEWLAADPTHPSLPVGRRMPALKEVWVDPLNPEDVKMETAGDAEFVAVGALPRRFEGAGTPTTGGWTLVAPASDGSFPIVAGNRYQIIVTTPATEPTSTASQIAQLLLWPAMPIAWALGWRQGGAWAADDTTNLFAASGAFLVENVTQAPGTSAWTVQAVAKQNASLATTKDVAYVQVLQQSSPVGASGGAGVVVAPPAGLSNTQKLLFGLVVTAVVAGGVYVAVKHYQRYEVPRQHANRRYKQLREEEAA